MTLAAQEQRALVDRLMSACGGSYSPEIRRHFFISGPQWAAAYRGQALFHRRCLAHSVSLFPWNSLFQEGHRQRSAHGNSVRRDCHAARRAVKRC